MAERSDEQIPGTPARSWLSRARRSFTGHEQSVFGRGLDHKWVQNKKTPETPPIRPVCFSSRFAASPFVYRAEGREFDEWRILEVTPRSAYGSFQV